MLVFGGSIGARSINEAAVEAFRAAPFRVLHAAGRRDYDALAPRVVGERYDLRPYIDDFARGARRLRPVRRALGRLDLRDRGGRQAGGARPLPARERRPPDRQRGMDGVRGRGGRRIGDAELTPARLGQVVGSLLADPARLASMAAASASLARPDAAQAVADEVLAAAAARRAARP